MMWDCWRKNTIRKGKRQVGNFPQALSHIALINAAFEFNRLSSPGEQRAQSSPAEQHCDRTKTAEGLQSSFPPSPAEHCAAVSGSPAGSSCAGAVQFGVTSTSSSSAMNSIACSRFRFLKGTRRIASSAVDERMLVSFFSRTMFTSRSLSREFSPTTMPS